MRVALAYFKLILVGVWLTASFIGCATTAKYEKALDSWVGKSEPELVKRWGPPDSVYQADGSTRMLTYYSSSITFFPATFPDYRISPYDSSISVNQYGGIPTEANHLKCKTSFTVVNNQITDWRWEGNDCG